MSRIYLTEGIVCPPVLPSYLLLTVVVVIGLLLDREEGGREVSDALRKISGVQVRSWRWGRGHGVALVSTIKDKAYYIE